LLASILLVKANRNPQALLIIIPLLVLYLLWLGFVRLLNFPSIARGQYDPLVASYAVGIAVLWLLAHKLANRNRLVTFLLALLIMIVVGLVGLGSCGVSAFDTIWLFGFLSVSSLAVLVGFVLAALLCRKHYSGLRFILWLAFWTVANSVAAMLAFMVIMFAARGLLPGNLTGILLQTIIAGLVIGILLYVINLSFMILGLSSPFFRERFYACLHLKPATATAPQAAPEAFAEQNPRAERGEGSGSV
jgi:hypothetical protein